LQIDRPNLVRFDARREQAGLPAVTIRELLRATLRHRPDRIIVGEVRGALSDTADPSTSLGCGLRKRALIRWMSDTCE
jgi:hypothetical protein